VTEKLNFNFENILEKEITQKDVFEHYAEYIVDNSMIGVSGTILSYG